MGETTHNHQQPPPPQAAAAAPPPPLPSLALSRGPTWTPAEQLQQLQYCIHSNPSWPETCLLAFEHYIVMLGTTVLIARNIVPRMGGDPGDTARVIQTLLFMAGINTLLQTIIGARLPTVMGPSYAFVLPVLSIMRDYNNETFSNEHDRFVDTMRTIQGSLIVSSFVNIILGFSKAWGNLTRFFSPITVAPVVCVVGLGLFMRGFPLLANCVEIGLPMLILLIICQYLKYLHPRANPAIERFGLLVCVGIIWAFAAILTVSGAYNNVGQQTKQSCRTDRSYLMSSAPWVKIPYPFQWGAPIFRASHVFGMIGAALVSSAESTGTFFAAARLAGATHPPAHVLSRSIGLQGVSLLLDGIFGTAVGTTASVENVGLLGLTHIGSRRVVQISTAFMFFFSIFGKFGALFASIPLPIFAAIYCVLFGIVAAIGISFIQFTNNNSMRNHYVLGLALFLGISIPQYFVSSTTGDGHGPVRTNGGWFNDILNTLFSSPPTVAMIVGTVLDSTLEARQTINDRGIPWWKPFQSRKGDVRTDEFYSLPLRINEWMPTRFL
ncbi:PREDICTED: nucleobase-ascorbate transporter 3-like [Populus euphratica]|uniref:Nucleobase-ascorbate transporter 3-like n=1 Tax=Populus euphratica TaxID=75702 RepID=A0AAJ6TUE9_POPEU|nr:PREDICTED: nucleobase-ascorbate transporter 3-like [Populus euphratica]